jgi:hypothetical protein
LVVLSGDQVNGDTAPDAPTVSVPFPPLWVTFLTCPRLCSRSCRS